ncbi:phosphotransferase family protein [Dongia deserti]|uniref:phosphotransferase family protein n=1 Tax=Dongia deserti TaxID=2268030 RepID=UPI000E658884|nr:phosphotransferase family protein [Dongia deserti]
MLPRGSVKALSDFLRKAAQAERADVGLERALPGDAGRAHYLISVEFLGGPLTGRHALVVRGQSDDRGSMLTGAEEFAIRRVAFGAGLTTPEPLWLEANGDALGWPFMVLRHAAGTVDAAALQSELSMEEGDRLAYRLGQELARLHRITLEKAPAEIAFLPHPDADWARRRAAEWHAALDDIGTPQPCFEWAINWFLDHAPGIEGFALCHRDLRLGNFVADGEQLVGILDLEQVRWSDPMEDLGWLCARGARHGLPDREAGGIGSREALYDGYKDVAGHEVDDRRVRFWEIAAAIRQGIAALQRAARPAGDAEQGLAAMLTGLRSLEAEYDLLLEIEHYAAEAA